MKKKVIVTGSLGLIGYEVCRFFLEKGYSVIGIDNNLRRRTFSIETDYFKKLKEIKLQYNCYEHHSFDIRNKNKIQELFINNNKTSLIVHTAAQTSHDWAKLDPFLDFSVNASGTLNLLEAFRKYTPEATFIYTSTNKVYGDTVNRLPFTESMTRYDLPMDHQYYLGIDENFVIDQSIHSLFGVSKTSADLLVQEYGRYFNLSTGIFRLGVITGSGQNPSVYQGYLSYLISKVKKNQEIEIFGYKGKQVRDILHAKDVAEAFYLYHNNPKKGAVYNLGGCRVNSISILEILEHITNQSSKRIKYKEFKNPRIGDHKWWITNTKKFQNDFKEWKIRYSMKDIIDELLKSYDKQR